MTPPTKDGQQVGGKWQEYLRRNLIHAIGETVTPLYVMPEAEQVAP